MLTLKTALIDQFDLAPGQRVLIACSGGADSVALATGMQLLSGAMGLRLGLAHLDHGLRGAESRRDADFVRALARRLALPLHTARADLGGPRSGIEARGREARYAFFNAVCRQSGYRVLATGHQADDNAEHVLMALMRGSGPRGLAGIPPSRPSTDCRVIRPLLAVRRHEIRDFLQTAGVDWVEDSSNRSPDHARNRVRHRLLPLMAAEFNPEIVTSLNRLAGILRAEERWLTPVVEGHLAGCRLTAPPGGVVLDAKALLKMPTAARRRVLRTAVAQAKGDLRRIALVHVDALTGLMRSGDGELHLPDRLHAVARNGRLSLAVATTALRQSPKRLPAPPPPAYRYTLDAPGRLQLVEAGLWFEAAKCGTVSTAALKRLPPEVACVDLDRLCFPLTVRSRRSTDRFHPLGMAGPVSLKRFMGNLNIAAPARPRCPLVVSQGEIIWVGGHRISERVKIDACTQRVLRMELSLAV
jgi:tRNA(Ile)-lysidine synthase